MIIDFHTHVFPEAIRNHREKFFAAEPAFKLLYESPKSKLVDADILIQAMDKGGVDKSVIFGFPWKDQETAQRNNDYIIEAVQRFPNRLIGLGCMDPLTKNADKEAERCLESGLLGIGEIALYQAGIDETAIKHLAPIMELCHKYNLPVLMHTNECVGHEYPGKAPITLDQIYTFVKSFPDNRIVLAHWGGGLFFFNLLKREVREVLKNVYFDTAASPFLYESNVYELAVQLVGVEKILFGSDYPLLSPQRYFTEMEQGALSRENRDKICGLNARQVLNLNSES